jgi:two-component sensor histidine kinase
MSDVKGRSRGGIVAENARLRRLLVQAGIDASKHEVAEQLQRLLLEEVHHRVKNTLTTVIAITSQSLRSAESLKQADQAIGSRLAALGKAHNLLLRVSWSSAKLSGVIAESIEAYGADRFIVRGTDVGVDARAVLSVAMVLNELCTNAVKYGALSNTTGHVEITGTPTTKHHASSSDEKAPCIKIVWTEKGGPIVHEPRQRSFGTRLIEQSFGELLGAARMRFEPAGVICEFDVPLASPTPPQSD